jgi:ubiquinone/menaquinone biosynthesis C-methylase UbiE
MENGSSMTRDWRALFESTYAAAASPVQERIWRAALGEEYPEGVDPYSFVTRSELGQIAEEVRVGPGDTLLDIGCGRGGAGLWVAASTGADLVGIDIAEAALVDARRRAAAMAMPATFRRGEFEATGLDAAAVDAIMSVDALLFTPDKAAAFVELRRVLRTGGRLVLTSWDYHRQPAGRPPQVPDHRPLAATAGFEVLAYETADRWRERSDAIGQGLLDAVDELAAESGEDVAEVLESILEMNATTKAMIRRFLLVAEAR